MQRADQLAARVLRGLEIVGKDVERAITDTASELWPGLAAGTVEAGSFRRGVLRVVFDDHARMAEAKSFLADEFRQLVNDRLQQRDYVTRVVFHVRGTEP